MANLLFYFLSAITVVAAVTVVVARSPVVSVLSLLGSFFCLAGIYLLAGFQFMAAAQLLVYAGAVMVLFLFVIMLLNMGDRESYEGIEPGILTRSQAAAPLLVAGGLMLAGLLAIRRADLPEFDPAVTVNGIDDVERLAAVIFSTFGLPFEAASILLLATAVGVMVLAKRERGTRPKDELGTTAVRPDASPAPGPEASQPNSPADREGQGKDTLESVQQGATS